MLDFVIPVVWMLIGGMVMLTIVVAYACIKEGCDFDDYDYGYDEEY
ncbi:hypothetical protein [Ellagibacter isourolithinifaciens]|nr:hypothetical protein [Ellagibacter isourolithinifaciens]MDD5925511.1 hypothetical protein [Ellagibacter isourolithinifaciens]